MKILETKELKKYYGKGDTLVKALDGVDLSVEDGEFVAIVGTSGSGKSTLLHMLGGLDRPTSGSVIVDGKDIFSLKDEALTIFRRRNIGFVFQAFNLIPELTVEQNILFPVLLDYQKPDTAYLEELLDVLDLRKRRSHLPGQLSGGQQQRVAIARALALHPDILCFDEPTSALDPELTGEVLRVLRDLADRKTTMIIVTHEMNFARDVADRILFMDGGVVVEQGPARQLIEHPQEERTRRFLAHYSE